MALVYWYREPDDNTVPFPTELDYTRVRTYTLEVTGNAEEGSVGISTITMDDPDATLDIVGHRLVAVQEPTVTDPAQTWIFVGYAAERRISRGPYRTGASRQWEVTVVDINTMFGRRIMVASHHPNRPAETDIARIQWLLSTSAGQLINDDTYVNTSGAVPMDAVDYTGQTLQSVIDDCAQQSGKNYFLIVDGTDVVSAKYPWGKYVLWYDFTSSTAYTSTISLTNDLASVTSPVGGSTFPISNEVTTLTRDPSRVYTGVYIPFDGGASYVYNQTTANNFARRDAVSPAENVKTVAKAEARAARFLADVATEEDVIQTSFQVPAASVNLLREGMRVPFQATHLPGYETPQWMRVMNRTVKQDSELTYTISVELVGGGTPAATSTNFLVMFLVQDNGSQPEDLSTHGWTQAWWSGDFTTASGYGGGAGPPQNQGMGMYYRAISSGETTTVASFKPVSLSSIGMWVYQIAGCNMAGLTTIHSNTGFADGSTTTVSGTAASSSVLFGGIAYGKVNYDGGWCTGWSGATPMVTTSSGTQLVNKSSQNDCTGVAPWAWVGYATGTGTLTIGATANSHGAGSGAYSGGFNVGKGGLLIPATAFAITQSAFAGSTGVGAPVNVILPSPPTP